MVKISEYDDKLMQMIKRWNLSAKRIQYYNLVFSELFELFNELPSELLDELREEQEIFVDEEGNPRPQPIEW